MVRGRLLRPLRAVLRSTLLAVGDTHRIQRRNDDKRYALGVLGAGSLLLTQLRYEHGNRFKEEH